MSLPNSLRAYEDCKTLFDAAVADPKGARGKLGTYESCINMRTRMHYFRTLDRKANESIYASDHPMFGTSVYDDLVVQILRDEDDEFWLYITPRSAKIITIEGLSEVGDLVEAEFSEVKMIEGATDA